MRYNIWVKDCFGEFITDINCVDEEEAESYYRFWSQAIVSTDHLVLWDRCANKIVKEIKRYRD